MAKLCWANANTSQGRTHPYRTLAASKTYVPCIRTRTPILMPGDCRSDATGFSFCVSKKPTMESLVADRCDNYLCKRLSQIKCWVKRFAVHKDS